MDFESLPGSQIYLTRQLELRWFYHWEVADEAAKSSSSSAASEDDHDATMTHHDNDHDVNHETNGQFKGCLVRKQHHTMPFLRRNIATNTSYSAASRLHIIKRHRANVRGRPNRELMIAIQNGKYNPSSSFAASLERKKNVGVGGKKRKAAAGEDSAAASSNNKRARTNKSKTPAAVVKKDAQQSEKQQQKKPKAHKQQTKPSTSSSSDSFPSFAIYSQISSIRTKLLHTLPKEFHGDETFILDKLREQWLLASRESKRLNGIAGEASDSVAADDSTSGKEEDERRSMSTVNDSSTTTKRGDKSNNEQEGSDPKLPLAVSSNTDNKSVVPPLDMAMSSLQTLQKYDGTKQHYKQNQTLPPAYFHYVFMQPNNVLGTHVEEIDGRICPVCNNLFDGETNEGLLRHLGNYHGTLIESSASNRNATGIDVDGVKAGEEDGAYFESALGEEGQLHIVVRGVPLTANANHNKDFVFVQPRLLCKSSNKVNKQQQQASNTIPYLQRQHHKTATLDPITRNKKLLTLQSNDAPASAISAYLPTDTIPLRQYFHADTNLPMSNDSWDKDDSCNNVDETWRSNMSSEFLEEIEDVSPKEKMFMKLWNGYIKCNHVLADRDISAKCRDFVRVHCKELIQGELRLNLLLHLFNLWDNGVISEDRILVCMEVFDEYGR